MFTVLGLLVCKCLSLSLPLCLNVSVYLSVRKKKSGKQMKLEMLRKEESGKKEIEEKGKR